MTHTKMRISRAIRGKGLSFEESNAVVEIGWESIVVLVAVAEVAARVAEVAMACTAVINVIGTSKISACPPSVRARDTNIKLEEYILSGLTGTVCSHRWIGCIGS